MTTYSRNDRYAWRQTLRRWRRIVNHLLAVLVTAVLLAPPAVATAAPTCPGGTATPHGCSYEQPGMTCAWPLRLVKIGKVTFCLRQAPEVLP